MWAWLMGMDGPYIAQVAGCQKVYTDWKLTHEERLNEGAWVVAYRQYQRTGTDMCTGQTLTESKTEGPIQLWPAVPRQRVADVSKPQATENAVSGTPLRTSDGGPARESVQVGPNTNIGVYPTEGSIMPDISSPGFPLGLVLLVGAVAYTFAKRQSKKASPASQVPPVQKASSPPPVPGNAPSSYSEENGQHVAPPVVVEREDGTWVWNWRPQYKSITRTVQVEEQVEIREPRQVQTGVKPVKKREKRIRTERVKVGTRTEWERVSLGWKTRQVQKTRLVEKEVVVGYKHERHIDGLDVRTRQPYYRIVAIPIIEKRLVPETYYETERYEDFDMIPRPVPVYEDREVEEYVSVTVMEPVYETVWDVKTVTKTVEKEVPDRVLGGWTGEWSFDSGATRRVKGPHSSFDRPEEPVTVEPIEINVDNLDDAMALKEEYEKEFQQIPQQIVWMEELLAKMPEDDKKAIEKTIQDLQNRYAELPGLIETATRQIDWYMDQLPEDLQRFKDHFVALKHEYWRQVILSGESVADQWDKTHYQPLREIRNKYKDVVGYRRLVGQVQAAALEVHEAYEALYEAKEGWWMAHLAGDSTDEFVAKAKAARVQLQRVSPNASALWSQTWHFEFEMEKRKQQFIQAYREYWQALLNCDPQAVVRTQEDLLQVMISPASQMGQEIEGEWIPRLKERYLTALFILNEGSSSDWVRDHENERLQFWRDHLPLLTQEWDAEVAGGPMNRGTDTLPVSPARFSLSLPVQEAVLTTPYEQHDSLHASHGGIDLIGETNVMPAASGRVVFAGRDPVTKSDTDKNGLGYTVVIDHGNDYFTVYGHLAAGSIRVKPGDQVTGGETLLGFMGNTGFSTGTHLHFELRKGEWDSNHGAPWNLLEKENPWLFLESYGWGVNFRRLMEDSEFTDTSITLDQVKKVLRKSATFKDYVDSGNFPVYSKKSSSSAPEWVKTVDIAQAVYHEAVSKGINPLLLLARLHTEQSLLSPTKKFDPTDDAVLFALGYAVPDSGDIDYAASGIELQIKHAARRLRELFDKPDFQSGPVLVKDLHPLGAVSRTKSAVVMQAGQPPIIISEHLGVENRATWALYQYTPHIIDLNLLLNSKVATRHVADEFPDVYSVHPGATVGGGNLLFMRSWEMVKDWVRA